MEEKAKKLCGYIFAALVVVGLVLVIVGMCTNVVSMEGEGSTLFEEGWGEFGMPSNTFAIISFIVAIAGVVVLLVDAILRVFMGKDLKIVRIIGAALALIGAILILVAGLMLAGDMNDLMDKMTGGLAGAAGASVSAGIGVWLGFIGGLVAAVAGGLPLLKQFN